MQTCDCALVWINLKGNCCWYFFKNKTIDSKLKTSNKDAAYWWWNKPLGDMISVSFSVGYFHSQSGVFSSIRLSS